MALALGIGGPPTPRGPVVLGTPPELDGIEIVDRRGAEVPGDLTFTDQDGQRVQLAEYFDGKRPTILVLAYYECPMLCSVVIGGLMEGMRGVEFNPGRDYHVVVVSFDPRDTAELAAKKRATYLEAFGREPGERGWDFLVGDAESVKLLAETVGFAYRWDEHQREFAHAAGIFLLTPRGKLSQTLMGIEFKGRDLQFALMEASQGRLGTTWQKLVLRCFHYDPNARGYVLVVFQLFKYFGMVVLAAVLGFLFYAWRFEKFRKPPRMEQANVRT